MLTGIGDTSGFASSSQRQYAPPSAFNSWLVSLQQAAPGSDEVFPGVRKSIQSNAFDRILIQSGPDGPGAGPGTIGVTGPGPGAGTLGDTGTGTGADEGTEE